MGNTYANVTVVDTTVDDVVRALGAAEALVAGGDGAVVVFAAADEHDGFSAGITARMLSTALERPALEVAVFDDDLLQYQLFVDGELVDEAAVPEDVAAEMVDESAGEVIPVSSPDRLVAALGRGSLVAMAEVLATEDLVFVSELHQRLAAALDCPPGPRAGASTTSTRIPTSCPSPSSAPPPDAVAAVRVRALRARWWPRRARRRPLRPVRGPPPAGWRPGPGRRRPGRPRPRPVRGRPGPAPMPLRLP